MFTPTNSLALPAPSLPTIFNPTHQSLIDSFLSGRNQLTIAAYSEDLKNFCSFLSGNTEVEPLNDAAKVLLSHGHGFANALALKYKTHLIEQGLAPGIINRRLAALRSLVKLARTLGLVSFSLEIQNMKAEPYRDTKGCGKSGYKTLLEAAKTERKRPKTIRDTALLHRLYDMSLRRGEVRALNVEDVDFEAGSLAVKGKGRVQKNSLTLPLESKSALSAWIKIRGEEPGQLFINLDPAKKGDGRLCANGFYSIIRALGKKCGIRVAPHKLRHSSISEALNLTSGDVHSVMKYSRHRSVGTVLVYDDCREDRAEAIAQMVASAACL